MNPLKNLPLTVASDPPPSLAGRNLLRGWRMRLPNGQGVARAMGLVPLTDAEIKIGKFSGDPNDILGSITDVAGPAFVGNCPLWTYVLAETVEEPVSLATTQGNKAFEARKLGPVGRSYRGRDLRRFDDRLTANPTTSVRTRYGSLLWR